jgi:TPR repeat protein
MRVILIVAALICMQACAPILHSQDYIFGRRAFANGDFKNAYRELLPAAADGKADAEYAIGYMYYYGYGAPQDTDTGIFWMKKSAKQNYAPAVKALDLIKSPKVRGDKLLVKT